MSVSVWSLQNLYDCPNCLGRTQLYPNQWGRLSRPPGPLQSSEQLSMWSFRSSEHCIVWDDWDDQDDLGYHRETRLKLALTLLWEKDVLNQNITVKIAQNHLKYSFGINKRNLLGEYSLFFEPRMFTLNLMCIYKLVSKQLEWKRICINTTSNLISFELSTMFIQLNSVHNKLSGHLPFCKVFDQWLIIIYDWHITRLPSNR